jgi:hypothetical protein
MTLRSKSFTDALLAGVRLQINSTEQAWAKVKRYIRERSVSGDIKMQNVEAIVFDGIQTVAADDWKFYCAHVEKLEKEYWTRDGIMEKAIDEVIFNINASDNISSNENEVVFSEHDSNTEAAVVLWE